MDLSRIRPPVQPDLPESLTAALVELLRAAGGHTSPADMNAALGISFVTLATTNPDPAEWVQAGRDFNVEPAAALFGIRLRDLHPRDAAAGLRSAPEFQQHFADSYYPLIRRSLEHHEPVLAYRGWPGTACRNWGVITGVDKDGRLTGVVLAADSIVALESAAVQCYVVESVSPAEPANQAIAQCTIAGCKEAAGRGPRGDALIGPAVWTVLQTMTADAGGDLPLERLRAFAFELLQSRDAAANFARRLARDDPKGYWGQIERRAAEMHTRLGSLTGPLGAPLERGDQSAFRRVVAALAAMDNDLWASLLQADGGGRHA
jgi:hypothetical protein